MLNALNFAISKSDVRVHWQGQSDCDVDDVEAYNTYRNEQEKIPLVKWVRTHAIPIESTENQRSQSESESESESDHDNGSNDGDNTEDGYDSYAYGYSTSSHGSIKSGRKHVFKKPGLALHKGSCYRGVYRAGLNEWDVYLTPHNAAHPLRMQVCLFSGSCPDVVVFQKNSELLKLIMGDAISNKNLLCDISIHFLYFLHMLMSVLLDNIYFKNYVRITS